MSDLTPHIDLGGSAFSRKTANLFDQFIRSSHSIALPFSTQVCPQSPNTSLNSLQADLAVQCSISLLVTTKDSSQNLPFRALRLVTLPMGWTNSVPIFHEDVTYILRDEIPHVTVPYIDDVPVKGPKSRYIDQDGNYETIPQNPNIRRFVWEHFQNLNRVVQRMRYCGGTYSGKKLYLCVPEIIFLGHRCTING